MIGQLPLTTAIHPLAIICYSRFMQQNIVGSVVEWLKRRDCDQHGFGSKPTRAILLCPWKRHFTTLTTLSPVWSSWQAVLNFSHISEVSSEQQDLGIFGSRSE